MTIGFEAIAVLAWPKYLKDEKAMLQKAADKKTADIGRRHFKTEHEHKHVHAGHHHHHKVRKKRG